MGVNFFFFWGGEGVGRESSMVSQRAPKHTTCKSNDWFPYETQHWVELVNPFLPAVII